MKVKVCRNCKKLMAAAAGNCPACGGADHSTVELSEEQQLAAVRNMCGIAPVEQSEKYRLMSLGMKALPVFYALIGFAMLFFAVSSHNRHLEAQRRIASRNPAFFAKYSSSSDVHDGFFVFWCVMVVIAVAAASLISFFVLRFRRKELVREHCENESSELFRFKQLYSMNSGAATAAPSLDLPAVPTATAASAVSATAGKIEHLSFGSAYQANCALAQMYDVEQISVNYETSTSYGLLANHADLSGITVTAVRTGRDNGTICQIADHEYTRLYLEDRSDMRLKLQNKNPEVRIISAHSITNTRGQAGLNMMLGIGVSSHRHVFVLYRVRRDCPASIVF